jgi:hypothetical protein
LDREVEAAARNGISILVVMTKTVGVPAVVSELGSR